MTNELDNNLLLSNTNTNINAKMDHGPVVEKTCNDVSSKLLNKFTVENNIKKNITTDEISTGGGKLPYNYNLELFGFEISAWYILLAIIVLVCIIYLIYVYMLPSTIVNIKKNNNNKNKKTKKSDNISSSTETTVDSENNDMSSKSSGSSKSSESSKLSKSSKSSKSS
jgi:hypothetical protein